MMRYSVSAAALGAGWFVVLLIPRITREWLLGGVARNLVCLMIASVIVAAAGRSFIARAETLGANLVRAVVLPYAGCLVFLTLTAATMWTKSLLVGGLMNLHDTLSLYAMGLTATTVSCVVVVPYALFCQYVMRSAAALTSVRS